MLKKLYIYFKSLELSQNIFFYKINQNPKMKEKLYKGK